MIPVPADKHCNAKHQSYVTKKQLTDKTCIDFEATNIVHCSAEQEINHRVKIQYKFFAQSIQTFAYNFG